LQAFTGATRTASGAIAENEGTLKGLTQELRETEKRLIDLALAQDKAAEKGDTDEVERLSGEIARLTQEQATLNQEILTVNSTIATQRGLLDTLKISSQGAADALSASVGAAFSKLVDAGVPVLDVVDQLEPVVSELGASFQSAGFEGSTAFQQLQATMALAKDEIAGPAITAVTGLGNVLAGLSNTGLLTQDMFSGLTGQITSTFGTLIAGGADGETALRLMQDPLQTVYELSQEFGFAVDESTQALVEQAKEQGIVGEKFKSVQKQMLDATNKLVSAIERLANSFTGSLARQAEAGARSVQRSLDGIEAPSLTIEIDYSDPGFTPNVSGGEYPEFQHGSGGIRNFGTGTLAMLHGREAVLTEHQLNRVGGRNSKAVVVNLSVEPHFHGVFTNDPVGLRTVSRDVLAPQLVSSLTRDDAGLVKAIKKAIGR
jgi:hypothetical protein